MITPQSKATIFGRYLGQKIEGEYFKKVILTPGKLNAHNEFNGLKDVSLLLTDLKDITWEHRSLWITNGGKIDGNKEILWQLGYATSHTVIENGQPITISVADQVKFNIVKIRE